MASPLPAGTADLTPRSTFRSVVIGALAVLLTGFLILEGATLIAENRVEQKRREIATAGGRCKTERNVPDWLKAVAGSNAHSILDRTVITEVTMRGAEITDRAVAPVRDLPGLQVLDLEDSAITSTSLASIARLNSLKSLSLVNTKVDRVTELAALGNLERLLINFSKVRGEELDVLAGMPRLRILGAGGLQITDEDVAAIARCGQLEELSLAGATLGPEGLRPLQNLKGLRFLSLKDAKVDPTDLAALQAAMPKCKIVI